MNDSNLLILIASPSFARSACSNLALPTFLPTNPPIAISIFGESGALAGELQRSAGQRSSDLACVELANGGFKEEPVNLDLSCVATGQGIIQTDPKFYYSIASLASGIRRLPKALLVWRYRKQQSQLRRGQRVNPDLLSAIGIGGAKAIVPPVAQRQAQLAEARRAFFDPGISSCLNVYRRWWKAAVAFGVLVTASSIACANEPSSRDTARCEVLKEAVIVGDIGLDLVWTVRATSLLTRRAHVLDTGNWQFIRPGVGGVGGLLAFLGKPSKTLPLIFEPGVPRLVTIWGFLSHNDVLEQSDYDEFPRVNVGFGHVDSKRGMGELICDLEGARINLPILRHWIFEQTVEGKHRGDRRLAIRPTSTKHYARPPLFPRRIISPD